MDLKTFAFQTLLRFVGAFLDPDIKVTCTEVPADIVPAGQRVITCDYNPDGKAGGPPTVVIGIRVAYH